MVLYAHLGIKVTFGKGNRNSDVPLCKESKMYQSMTVSLVFAT